MEGTLRSHLLLQGRRNCIYVISKRSLSCPFLKILAMDLPQHPWTSVLKGKMMQKKEKKLEGFSFMAKGE